MRLVADDLLAAFPRGLPKLPVVQRKREPTKRALSGDDRSQNIHDIGYWLTNRHGEQECAECGFRHWSVPLFSTHLMTKHN